MRRLTLTLTWLLQHEVQCRRFLTNLGEIPASSSSSCANGLQLAILLDKLGEAVVVFTDAAQFVFSLVFGKAEPDFPSARELGCVDRVLQQGIRTSLSV